MTATPFTATILGSPRIGPNRELKRAVEKYWAGRLDRGELESVAATLRRDTWESLARRRAGFGSGEYFLVLRPGARHRRAASVRCPPAVAGVADDLDRYFAAARGNDDDRAAGDDQVVRHQLPLHRSRDRPDTPFALESGQGARRIGRGPRTGDSRPGRSSSGRSRSSR